MGGMRRITGLMLVLALLSWGCAHQRNGVRTWIDLSEVNQQIVKAKEDSPILMEGEPGREEAEAETAPRVKDLAVGKDGGNPELKKIAAADRQPKEKEAEGGILLNFENADIYEVIRVVAETLDFNYIVDPQVKGVVSIRSGKPIPREELFSVFKKILNINGLDIIPEGSHQYIYVTPTPSVQTINCPTQVNKLGDSPDMVMQVVQLMHMASAEAIDLISPYLSNQGITYNLADQNMIIIADFESKIVDILQILTALDVSPLASFKMRLLRVDNAPLFDLHDELAEILAATRVTTGKGFEGINVLPLERVNSLLLISKNDYLLDNVGRWVRELDVAPTHGRDGIYFYNVRNTVASELAELVNNVLHEEEGTAGARRPTAQPATQAARQNQAAGQQPARTTTAAGSRGVSTVQLGEGPLLIADDSRNIILIRAMPSDYSRIVKLLERLDNLPRQVLIEVMVAEVTLSDRLEFGVEWALKNNSVTINGTDYTGNIFLDSGIASGAAGFSGTGFTYNLVKGSDDVRALLKALDRDSDVAILSSPQILVLNNEPASINVGNQVPIITSQITSAEATTVDQTSVTQSIQYKDTGVIMNVTPRINFNGIITLEIDQQVSNVGEAGVAGSPQIFNRQLKTKLAVKDGQSIMIGGLISKNNNVSESGIPLLKDIPLLGYLFKSHIEDTTRTELLVMITPYVIESEDVLEQYFRTFKDKMAELREELTVEPKNRL